MPERVGLLDDDGSRFLREYLVAGNPQFSKVRFTGTVLSGHTREFTVQNFHTQMLKGFHTQILCAEFPHTSSQRFPHRKCEEKSSQGFAHTQFSNAGSIYLSIYLNVYLSIYLYMYIYIYIYIYI